VDCDTVDLGCQGGWPADAFTYIKQAGGLESEAAYPYTAVDGKCVFNASAVKAKISGYTYVTPSCETPSACPKQDEQTLLNNLAASGPSSICVDAIPFQTYISGILKNGCETGYDYLDHCVQLVGYSSTQSGYWIVRNSWGTNWGLSGYIYLAYGQNTCGLADQATLPTIASEDRFCAQA